MFSLIQRDRFVYIEENFYESAKLFSIKRNFFFDLNIKETVFWVKHVLFNLIKHNGIFLKLS